MEAGDVVIQIQHLLKLNSSPRALLSTLSQIQIQHLLKLNLVQMQTKGSGEYNSNTTLVKVK